MRSSWNKGLKGYHIKSHGCSDHRLYKTWKGMMERCNDPSNKDFKNYGGRGIKVSKRWHDVRLFVEDMYPSFKEGLSIDRKNNNRGYSKGNCRWATVAQQVSNTRLNRYITHGGITMTIADWAKKIGTSRQTIRHRLEHGWTHKEIATLPVDYANRIKR